MHRHIYCMWPKIAGQSVAVCKLLSTIAHHSRKYEECTEWEDILQTVHCASSMASACVAMPSCVPQVLRDFDLRVRPGQVVAVVGASGSGKSTLLNLLLRFYDVEKGEVSTVVECETYS